MNYLLIDTGNSFSKFVFYTSQQYSVVTRCETSALVDSIIRFNPNQPDTLTKIILVSVVDDNTTRKLLADLNTAFATEVIQVKTAATAYGVSCGYQNPALLGADRWVALVAAFNLLQPGAKQPLMVIDCGTVLTVDMLDKEGQHLGGWMMPSSKLMRQCLSSESAAIKHGLEQEGHAQAKNNSARTGQSTLQCIELGGQLAETGFIEQCIRQGRDICGESLRIIVSGGGAENIIGMLSMPVEHKPDLVVKGLALFIE